MVEKSALENCSIFCHRAGTFLYISTILDEILSFLSSVLDILCLSKGVVRFYCDCQNMESPARTTLQGRAKRGEEVCGGVYVVVSGDVPAVSVQPAPRIMRIRIAVVVMVNLLNCMEIELC